MKSSPIRRLLPALGMLFWAVLLTGCAAKTQLELDMEAAGCPPKVAPCDCLPERDGCGNDRKDHVFPDRPDRTGLIIEFEARESQDRPEFVVVTLEDSSGIPLEREILDRPVRWGQVHSEAARPNAPITRVSILQAGRFCTEKLYPGDVRVGVPHLYLFEYAVRKGLIQANRLAPKELVRIPTDTEAEQFLRIEDEEHFEFRKFDTHMLIFDWETGRYEPSLKSYAGQTDTTFRCMR